MHTPGLRFRFSISQSPTNLPHTKNQTCFNFWSLGDWETETETRCVRTFSPGHFVTRQQIDLSCNCRVVGTPTREMGPAWICSFCIFARLLHLDVLPLLSLTFLIWTSVITHLLDLDIPPLLSLTFLIWTYSLYYHSPS